MNAPLAFSSYALSFSDSVLVVLALVAAVVAFSIWSYRRTVPEISRGRRILLTSLRASALSLLVFVLFEPILNLTTTETLPPRVLALLDNSRSMTIEDTDGTRSAILREALAAAAFRDMEPGAVVSYGRFSAGLHVLDGYAPDSLTFGGSETNISAALSDAVSAFEGKNLRAVVLFSDGVFTTGRNPVGLAERMGVPVYTVVVGDTVEKKDVLIREIVTNEIAFLDSEIPVEVTVHSVGYPDAELAVSLREGEKLLETRTVQLGSQGGDIDVAFTYRPSGEGMRRLTASVAPLPGELTTRNNSRSVMVKIRKTRMRVTLVAAAPSPDVALFRRVLLRDRNIQLTSFIQKSAQSWYDPQPGADALKETDCLVLVGFPFGRGGAGMEVQITDYAVRRMKPVLVVVQRKTDPGRLVRMLGSVFPVDVVSARSDEMEVFFQPTQRAFIQPVTSSGIARNIWPLLPPLFRTQSSFTARIGSEVLGKMKINDVEFDEPLLVARKLGRSRALAFLAYGLWRWETAGGEKGSFVPYKLIGNAIRWLTTREDEKFVRIRPTREMTDNGEPVVLEAQVYNESYEPVDDAEVRVTITGKAGAREVYLEPVRGGQYRARIEALPEGDYTYEGAAMRNGEKLGSDKGRFSVGEVNIEFLETRADAALLQQVAYRSGGKFYTPRDVRELAADLVADPDFRPVTIDHTTDIPLWSLMYILAFAIALFAIEWYLRKQYGML